MIDGCCVLLLAGCKEFTFSTTFPLSRLASKLVESRRAPMPSAKSFGSTYEELVLTKDHPAKVLYRNVEPPDYIRESPLGPFMATRWEEVKIVAFMAAVAAYCLGVYLAVYFGIFLPARAVMSYSWDALLIACVTMAVLGGKTRSVAKKLSMVVVCMLALARWQWPELYPSWYPFQPAQ